MSIHLSLSWHSLSLDATSACVSQVGIRKAMRRTLAHIAGVTVSNLEDFEHGCDATCTSYSRCLCDDAVAAYCNAFPRCEGSFLGDCQSCHHINSTTLDRIDSMG